MNLKKLVFVVIVTTAWLNRSFAKIDIVQKRRQGHFERVIKKQVHHMQQSALAQNSYRDIVLDDNIVIPAYSGGRFGDNIVAIAHTLYFAMKNQCKMFLVPFPYSDQLMLDDNLLKYFPSIKRYFKQAATFPEGEACIDETVKNNLFAVPYFPEAPIEFKLSSARKIFDVDWSDPAFRKELHTLIAPKYDLNFINPPKDKLSVAVHVRKGGGYDTFTDENYSGLILYKIPLDTYYINQIKKLSELLGHPPLYVFLFTDDQNPQALIDLYMKEINIPSIEFACRINNNHYSNVLEDFFSMMKFDMLIRSESSFSIMAEKLSNYSLVMSPGDFSPGTSINTGIVNIKNLDVVKG